MGKGIQKKVKSAVRSKTKAEKKAISPSSEGPERSLILRFFGAERPELDRIEFRCNKSTQPAFLQRGNPERDLSFSWTEVPQALSLIFLEYLIAQKENPEELYYFRGSKNGSLAASLGDAIYQSKHRIHNLFVDNLGGREIVSRVQQIFIGDNVAGKADRERRITISKNLIPSECIEIYWDGYGPELLQELDDLRLLLERIRSSLGIQVEPRTLVGEGSPRILPSPSPSAQPELTPIQNQIPEPKPLVSEPLKPQPAVPETRSVSPGDFHELRAKADQIVNAMLEGKTPEQIYVLLKTDGVLTTPDLVSQFCRAVSIAGIQPLKVPPKQEPATPPIQAPKDKKSESTNEQAAKPEKPELKSANELALDNNLPPKTDKARSDKQNFPPGPAPKSRLQPTPAPPPQPPSSPPQDPTPPKSAKTRFVLLPPPRIKPIDPRNFLVYSDGTTWNNEDPLLHFTEDEDDTWKLGDAFEGLAILGAPGSGKTSGSGTAFAEAMVKSGFGGLVLTVKSGEAQRWVRLCERCGRGSDVILISHKGPRLNFLAYESERPTENVDLAGNLVRLFRVLAEMVSRDPNQHSSERYWEDAINLLLKSLFETFILAGEPLSIDGLNRFLSSAPQQPLRDPDNDWLEIPIFGGILERASRQTDPVAINAFQNIYQYWTRDFPGSPPKARSSIVLGFTGIAGAFSGRGIHELVCSDTDVTPEAILSGFIIIIDLPIKEFGQGGLLVQAAWKHLFKTMVERRSRRDDDNYRYPFFQLDDNRLPTGVLYVEPGTGDRRRPVFLWEDEAHFFFTRHDVDFQVTARESRAAHVIISQNLHNFYQLGHNEHAVEAVFSSINTKVFHNNTDNFTNEWASKSIGMEEKFKVDFSTSPEKTSGFWDLFKLSESKISSNTKKVREPIVCPDKFQALKKGGDGICEAILHWSSHRFRLNGGRPCMELEFEQEPLQ